MAFLEDLKGFYGTGEKNRAGQSLEEFLDRYDPRKYDCPSCTTDIVAVQCDEPLRSWGQPLKLLLVKRGNHPSIGWYATPGGFVELKEDLYEGAARELQEETGVTGLPLQQLRTWGAYDRDPDLVPGSDGRRSTGEGRRRRGGCAVDGCVAPSGLGGGRAAAEGDMGALPGP